MANLEVKTLCEETCGKQPNLNDCYYVKHADFQHEHGGLTAEEGVIFDSKMAQGDPMGMECRVRG